MFENRQATGLALPRARAARVVLRLFVVSRLGVLLDQNLSWYLLGDAKKQLEVGLNGGPAMVING